MKVLWFFSGAFCGLAMLSVAMGSVPGKGRLGRVTDDSAIYQNLSEIQVAKERDLNFDKDIARLSELEDSYRERLPIPRVSKPLKRISRKPYRYTGRRTSTARN